MSAREGRSSGWLGRPLVAGRAAGTLVYSDEPLSFWGGYDAETGEIIDRRHPLSGTRAGGRVLAIPATRGSSTTTAVLLEAIRGGTAPIGVITRGPDRFLVLAAIVAREMYGAELPVVALSAEDYAALAGTPAVRIDEDGAIRPAEAQRR